jgi:excisionase family DNA binding protein
MEEAIAMLKTTRPTFYRWLRTGKVKGMKVGRQWRFYKADIERFLRGQEPKIELPTDIGPLLEGLTQRLKDAGGEDPSAPDDHPVLRTVAVLIALGVRMRASDIHVEPYEKTAVARLRVDGVLHKVAEFDLRLLKPIADQAKRMANVDVHERRLPQDGRIGIALRQAGGTADLDLRVSFLPAIMGEAITVRILRRDEAALSLDRIGYAATDRDRLQRAIESPWGLVVIAGPTGCGKSTVLYACLNHLVRPAVKCMSAEDPVEYMIPGVVQVGINEQIGLTFERVVRSFLRSDPDVMLIGELRNPACLMVALQAALTGHLVMSTLHSDSAAGTLKRMVDMEAPPFVIGDATRLVSAQRLVRCLCRKCSVPTEPPADQLDRAGQLARDGGLDFSALGQGFRKPIGCGECGQTGYRSRTLIAEMLEITPEIAQALRRGAGVDELRAIAVGQGMTTMAADGVRRAAEGQTTLDEVFRVLSLR